MKAVSVSFRTWTKSLSSTSGSFELGSKGPHTPFRIYIYSLRAFAPSRALASLELIVDRLVNQWLEQLVDASDL
jgi:hypothetical protein